jgi:hypothetical protein
MKAIIISLSLLTAGSFHFVAISQASINPGGVKRPTYWYVTDSSSSIFKNKLEPTGTAISLVNPAKNGALNFHPSLVFTANSRLAIDMGNINSNSASFFTVYQSTDTANENNIWYLQRDQKTNLVLTTRRMADLAAYEYMNYTDIVLRHPKVNVYVQHKAKDISAPVTQSLVFGKKTDSPQLPINSFSGMIPEVVFYDRPLGTIERLKVASYLAWKYGITLTEPTAVYLNSAGITIWNGQDYSAYHHNIAGIGRDDSTGLLQKIASSSNEPGLLTLSITDSLRNNSSFLWGDNGKTFTQDAKIQGLPSMLQRKWMLVSTGIQGSLSTDIDIDTRVIDVPLPEKPVYWLAIDHSGEEKYEQSSTEFIKMSQLNASGIARFNSVKWHKDNNAKELLSLIVAQDILVSAHITAPVCASGKKGKLDVHIYSGVPPYQIILKDASGSIVAQRNAVTDVAQVFSDIAAGRYSLKVTDNSGQVYSDIFYVNNADAPKPASIASSYLFEKGTVLHLDASKDMSSGVNYLWEAPGKSLTPGPQIDIYNSGIYILHSTKDNCTYQQEINIQWISADVFADSEILVYPNPSPGLFKVKVRLQNPEPVSVFIYDMSGRLIKTDRKTGFSNYQFAFELNNNGLYQVVLVSGQYKSTRSLLIAR